MMRVKVSKVKKSKKKTTDGEKKKKKTIDGEKKKKIPTGYLLYSAHIRPEVKDELTTALVDDEKLKPQAIISEIGKRWKALQQEERDEWNSQSAELKAAELKAAELKAADADDVSAESE